MGIIIVVVRYYKVKYKVFRYPANTINVYKARTNENLKLIIKAITGYYGLSILNAKQIGINENYICLIKENININEVYDKSKLIHNDILFELKNYLTKNNFKASNFSYSNEANNSLVNILYKNLIAHKDFYNESYEILFNPKLINYENNLFRNFNDDIYELNVESNISFKQ